MAVLDLVPHAHIVVVDFEFHFGGHASKEEAGRSGERPRPVCMVAKELRTGEVWRLSGDQFGRSPPFPHGDDTLLVAHYASAELGVYRALGWPQPRFVLDTFTEFRARTNGLAQAAGLIDAAAYFGIDAMESLAKKAMVTLILRGPPWSEQEPADFLYYCESDVLTLERIFLAMLPRIDLPHALLRGRFMKAAAAVEWHGIPIDVTTLALLRKHWAGIQDDLIAAIDSDYGVFDGRTFRESRWRDWLIAHGIPWPTLESGRLALDDDTFRQMAKAYPEVSPMRELRSALSEMRLSDLSVGADGRNRTILSAFRAKTARCQPSNTKCIFGPSVWLRGMIKPAEGWGVAYLDFSQQEFAIGAWLSGDEAMQAAYRSGDPYLAFAKQAGLVPADATKKSHGDIRELCKQCVLGTQYGMEARTLALRIGQLELVARRLLRAHHETYPKFWRWADDMVDRAMLGFPLLTVFGWPVHSGRDPNPRSMQNFGCQANGNEMLRLATILGTEAGIEVCALVHDAVLIAAPLDQLDHDIERMRAAMITASRLVIGFELRVDVYVVRYPDRYRDSNGRGDVMWARVMELVAAREAAAARELEVAYG
ncbi:DNA polymerase [Bradyrhizobium sp. I1.7.5]|uniref:DNA polymerase n=1 Tax=Bradyrhizobium sp. I1.7.5 TaxID=3156363 RepID=UPI003395E682